ncbi:MAG: hypothetical protein MI747_15040 [Desulfobacterales bacterium]|nr:hypothetical protein [Desulfobacterales bacterium]
MMRIDPTSSGGSPGVADSGHRDGAAEKPVINRGFYRDLVKERPQLLGAILRFNQGLNQRAAGALFGGESLPARLQSRLPAGRRHPGFWYFEEESRRMALLDAPVITALVRHWGTAFYSPLLSSFILKSQVDVLGETLGADALAFARGRGRFLLGNTAQILEQEPVSCPADEVAKMVMASGLSALAVVASAWPRPLVELWEDFLNREIPGAASLYEPLGERAQPARLRAAWFSIKKVLLKEVAPQWTALFS